MEDYQFFLLVISLLSFIAYFASISLKYGIQTSISTSFYTIEKHARKAGKNPNRKWWFSAALFCFAFPIIIVGVELQPIFFFAGAAIIFVAAAPAFKSTHLQERVHIVSAVGGISLAVLGFLAMGTTLSYIVAGCLLLGMGAMKYYAIENLTWWVETYAFMVTWLGLVSIICATS